MNQECLLDINDKLCVRKREGRIVCTPRKMLE